MNKKTIKKLVLLGVIAVIVCIAIFVPTVNAFVKKVLKAFATGDFQAMRDFIARYGSYAMAVSFLLMVFQSVAAPLPAFIITIANAMLFGWVKGAILSWSSAMAGAALCFYISKTLGRDVAVKLTSDAALKKIDDYFIKYGKNTILVCRLLPFIPFDAVSYAAGLTSMKFWPFFVATGLGQLPATIVYSYVAGQLTGGAKYLFLGLTILCVLVVVVAIAKKIYEEKNKK